MRTFACLIIVALVYTTKGSPSPHIVGGLPADIGEYPYQVSLKINGRHKCSGTIIDNLNILTAAQCVAWLGSWQTITVHGGTNFLDTPGHVHEVSRVIIHSNYSETMELHINDIALVHLKVPMQYNPLEQPINLATTDINIEDKSCTLTGWGATWINGEFSNNLQKIELRGYSQTDCARDWRNRIIIENNHVCTLTKQGLEGACHGDFGGPLVNNGLQIGILSMTGDPCASGLPDIYTKVTSFLPWIWMNLKK